MTAREEYFYRRGRSIRCGKTDERNDDWCMGRSERLLQATGKRNGALDALKFFAAVLIVCHHYQQVYDVRFSHFIDFYGGRFYFGYVVELFFVISGFVMVRYIPRIQAGLGFGAFYLARAARLLPLVAVTTVLYIAIDRVVYFPIFGDYINNHTPSSYAGGVLCILGIQDGWASPNPMINNPIWYISVLLLCYAVFWLVTEFAARKGIPVERMYLGMIGLGVLEAFLRMRFGFEVAFLNGASCRGYYAFFSGLLIARYLPRLTIQWKHVVAAVVVLLVTLPMIYRYHGFFLPFWLTFAAYPALLFVIHQPSLKRCFQHHLWQTLGAASYDVYIWHVICLVLFKVANARMGQIFDFGHVGTMFLVLALAEIVGGCSYLWLEHRLTTPAKRLAQYLVS